MIQTFTEIITALGLESQWRSVEAFLERGAWALGQVEDVIARTAAAGARCGGRRRRRIWALSRPEGPEVRQEDMGRLLVS